MSVRDYLNWDIARLKLVVRRKAAACFYNLYGGLNKFNEWSLRYGGLIFFAIVFLFLMGTILITPNLQAFLDNNFSTEPKIEGLRELIMNVGAALIGATAIVTSLVLFACQVNIERMPYGLFRRLSSDARLLGTFALAFFLAIGTTILSTLIGKEHLLFVVRGASWAIILTLILFIYAYRRALLLINPLQQLRILECDTRDEFRRWSRRIKRTRALFEQGERKVATLSSTHDLPRMRFFRTNGHWTDGSIRAFRHAMSFARRYAEQGDYEVSRAALNTILNINTFYIEAKGKTFFANNPFIDNPLATDDFINETLENLRQNAQAGIARRDEQQIEQTLEAMAGLVRLFLRIDYSNSHATKSHAHLAAGYLSKAVEVIIPHDMADVLMEGQRLLGRSAQEILFKEGSDQIVALSEKIASVACSGCVKESYRPVTMEGVSQLAQLMFSLIFRKDDDIGYAVKKVRENIKAITQLFLDVKDTPLSSIHSMILGPYYSSANSLSMLSKLTVLVNKIISAEVEDLDASGVILNIEQWADGIYQTDKELLLKAIKVKSCFSFDMIHWITNVTEILLALSNAPACSPECEERIRNHARWLIATLSWIPDDIETVEFIESFQLTETIFGAARTAYQRGCNEIARDITKSLLKWAFNGGRHVTGRGILEGGILGTAVLVLIDDNDEQVAWLKIAVSEKITSTSSLTEEVIDSTTRRLREKAGNLGSPRRRSSAIEMEAAISDHSKLRPLIEEIVSLLSQGAVH
jgi:hypothetical protein